MMKIQIVIVEDEQVPALAKRTCVEVCLKCSSKF
jgi:hypothetical protein